MHVTGGSAARAVFSICCMGLRCFKYSDTAPLVSRVRQFRLVAYWKQQYAYRRVCFEPWSVMFIAQYSRCTTLLGRHTSVLGLIMFRLSSWNAWFVWGVTHSYVISMPPTHVNVIAWSCIFTCSWNLTTEESLNIETDRKFMHYIQLSSVCISSKPFSLRAAVADCVTSTTSSLMTA